MKITDRIKLWLKLAQTTEQPGVQTLSGSPSAVDISNAVLGFGTNNMSLIQNIVNDLNWAIYVLSAGQLDFNKLKQQYFFFSNTNIPDQTLLIIVRYAKLIYTNLLTLSGGNTRFNQELDQTEKIKRIDLLLYSVRVPPTAIPDGGINNLLQTKIGGVLKTNLINNLQQMYQNVGTINQR